MGPRHRHKRIKRFIKSNFLDVQSFAPTIFVPFRSVSFAPFRSVFACIDLEILFFICLPPSLPPSLPPVPHRSVPFHLEVNLSLCVCSDLSLPFCSFLFHFIPFHSVSFQRFISVFFFSLSLSLSLSPSLPPSLPPYLRSVPFFQVIIMTKTTISGKLPLFVFVYRSWYVYLLLKNMV